MTGWSTPNSPSADPRRCSSIWAAISHVLPKGFKRIRHYGLLGPAGKATRLAQGRAALSAPTPDPAIIESVEEFIGRINRIEWLRCTHCGNGRFVPSAPIPLLRVPHVPHLRGPP